MEKEKESNFEKLVCTLSLLKGEIKFKALQMCRKLERFNPFLMVN
jgi:hypothetical protein